jgi:hypothetical protein
MLKTKLQNAISVQTFYYSMLSACKLGVYSAQKFMDSTYIDKNIDKILNDTISPYFDVKSNKDLVLNLKKLVKFDVCRQFSDGKIVFMSMSVLLEVIKDYEAMLDFYKRQSSPKIKPINAGLSHSTSKSISKILEHPIKTIEENIALETMGSDRNKTKLKVFEDFEEKPQEIDYMLRILANYISPSLFKLLAKEASEVEVNDEKLKAIYDSSKFLNAAMPIKPNDILKSFSIAVSGLYQKDSKWHLITENTNEKISDKVLAETINNLYGYIFNVKKFANPKKFTEPIQIRTFYEIAPLFEFQTEDNKKLDPMLDDEDLDGNLDFVLNMFQIILKEIFHKNNLD